MATYLSQYLRFHDKRLQEFCDPNDLWFGKNSMQNENNLSPLNALTKRYTKNEFIELLKKNSHQDLSRKERVTLETAATKMNSVMITKR